eukprot:GDKK01002056.1.p1 GENE.GDKK01002056.1~~GDKK01002056.1.p1  ORF type:complete len:414 (-),score=54.01 GDKK01002056.1:53-1294(-)
MERSIWPRRTPLRTATITSPSSVLVFDQHSAAVKKATHVSRDKKEALFLQNETGNTRCIKAPPIASRTLVSIPNLIIETNTEIRVLINSCYVQLEDRQALVKYMSKFQKKSSQFSEMAQSLFSCHCSGGIYWQSKPSDRDSKVASLRRKSKFSVLESGHGGHIVMSLWERQECLSAVHAILSPQNDILDLFASNPNGEDQINANEIPDINDKNIPNDEFLSVDSTTSKEKDNKHPEQSLNTSNHFILQSLNKIEVEFNSLPLPNQWTIISCVLLSSYLVGTVLYFVINKYAEADVIQRVGRDGGPKMTYLAFVEAIGAEDEEETRRSEAKRLVQIAEGNHSKLKKQFDDLMCCITAPFKTIFGKKTPRNTQEVNPLPQIRESQENRPKRPKFISKSNKIKFSQVENINQDEFD